MELTFRQLRAMQKHGAKIKLSHKSIDLKYEKNHNHTITDKAALGRVLSDRVNEANRAYVMNPTFRNFVERERLSGLMYKVDNAMAGLIGVRPYTATDTAQDVVYKSHYASLMAQASQRAMLAQKPKARQVVSKPPQVNAALLAQARVDGAKAYAKKEQALERIKEKGGN